MEISSNNSDNISNAILAILAIAKEADLNALTTTQVVKYVYLLDYLFAKNNAGKTYTSVEWKFLHFGPYSAAISHELDFLVNKSFINSKNMTSNKSDGVLYSLSDWKQVSKLDLFGVSRDIVLDLSGYVRRFNTDLQKLLNFVYFETEPMAEALPNEILSFDDCIKIPFKNLKPVEMKKLSIAAVKSTKEKLAKIRARVEKSTSQIEWLGKYDEVYFNGLKEILDSNEVGDFSGKLYL